MGLVASPIHIFFKGGLKNLPFYLQKPLDKFAKSITYIYICGVNYKYDLYTSEMSSNWKPYLQRLAREHKMCAENRAYLSACETKSDAIRIYKQTIDWALEEGYPDLDFLRKEFAHQESEGIYIDHHFEGDILNEHLVYVFHNCTGHIRVGLNLAKKIIPMCYFANNCDMTILGIENEDGFMPDRVPLYIFGENNINATNSNSIEVRIFRSGVKDASLAVKKGGKR